MSRTIPEKTKESIQSKGYVLGEFINEGGNALIFKVTKDKQVYAIKILKSKREEPLKRFISEIKFHKKYSSEKGVLHSIDIYHPKNQDKKDKPWIVMPLATPIREVLGDADSLNTVMKAILSISSTLARLANKGVYHRDIKPENLFKVGKQWVVGDFGLVKYPSAPSNNTGPKLGSKFYIAPEMINKAQSSDGTKADVYSLAKTLWALATGLGYPIPGPHLSVEGIRLKEWHPKYPRIRYLDVLLENCTSYVPEERLTMKEMHDELITIMNPLKDSASRSSISKLAKDIHTLTKDAREKSENRKSYRKIHEKTIHTLELKMNKIKQKLYKANLGCEINSGSNSTIYDQLQAESERKNNILMREGICIVVKNPDTSGRPILYMGIGLDIDVKEGCRLFSGYLIISSDGKVRVICKKIMKYRIKTALEEKSIKKTIQFLDDNLKRSLIEFKKDLDK